MQYPIEMFSSTAQVFELILILMSLSASAIFFVSPLNATAKHFPLRLFSFQGEQKESCSGQDLVNREGGTWGSG